MAAQVGGEVPEGREACVGGNIIRLEQENGNSDVDVVSIQFGDSFMRCLERYGNSIRFPFAQE